MENKSCQKCSCKNSSVRPARYESVYYFLCENCEVIDGNDIAKERLTALEVDHNKAVAAGQEDLAAYLKPRIAALDRAIRFTKYKLGTQAHSRQARRAGG